MSRILFVQSTFFPLLGAMHISAALRRARHNCAVALIGRHLLHAVRAARPNVIAFSCLTGEQRWLFEAAAKVKEVTDGRASIVVGGPLATFLPEIVNNASIDAICRGEGEEAMVELADAIDAGGGLPDAIRNFWIKSDGTVRKAPLRPLCGNLDDLPLPDRSLYKRYRFINRSPIVPIMTSRGCPFDCSYCFNHAYAGLYRGLGPRVRQRSVENVFEELEQIKREHPCPTMWFIDDMFATDPEWSESFLGRYRERVGTPFVCSMRFDRLNERTLRLLAKTGCCQNLGLGLESGDERYRAEVLNRPMTDEQILRGAELIRKCGLRFSTTNMMAMPGETIEMGLATVRLNRRLRPRATVCTVYQPIPDTRLCTEAIEQGLLDPAALAKTTLFSHGQSILSGEAARRLSALHKLFIPAVYLPIPFRLLKSLTRLPINPVLSYLHKALFAFVHLRREFNFTWLRVFEEAVVAVRHYRSRW